MMEETVTFLEYLLGLILGILVGIIFGGLWAVVEPTLQRNPFTLTHDSGEGYSQRAIQRALAAEEDFGLSWPFQDYAIHWWGWSATSQHEEMEAEAEGGSPTTKRDVSALFQQASSRTGSRVAAKLDPWFRLVWIRSVAALSILVAAVLPTFALWLDGRRRAYALLATGKMPSTRPWKIWGGFATILAIATGVLIGAPFPAAMAPWLFFVVLAALFALCQVRAYKNARLS